MVTSHDQRLDADVDREVNQEVKNGLSIRFELISLQREISSAVCIFQLAVLVISEEDQKIDGQINKSKLPLDDRTSCLIFKISYPMMKTHFSQWYSGYLTSCHNLLYQGEGLAKNIDRSLI